MVVWRTDLFGIMKGRGVERKREAGRRRRETTMARAGDRCIERRIVTDYCMIATIPCCSPVRNEKFAEVGWEE